MQFTGSPPSSPAGESRPDDVTHDPVAEARIGEPRLPLRHRVLLGSRARPPGREPRPEHPAAPAGASAADAAAGRAAESRARPPDPRPDPELGALPRANPGAPRSRRLPTRPVGSLSDRRRWAA